MHVEYFFSKNHGKPG